MQEQQNRSEHEDTVEYMDDLDKVVWGKRSEIVIVSEINGGYRGFRLTGNLKLRGHGA
jgi:hypothetical protein